MVAMNDILDFSERVAREFQPERIILFGSHAYGTPSEDSDVDILVIMPFEGKWLHKSVEILSRLDPDFGIDLITRRPDEVAQRYKNRDPLICEAIDRGKVLYERHH